MNQESTFLENLPAIFFIVVFVINLFIFLWWAFLAIFAKGDPVKVGTAKNVLSLAIKFFIGALIVFLMFSFVTYLLKKGQVLVPTESALPEFPAPAHLGAFPPAPAYITLGKSYFSGPYQFKKLTGLFTDDSIIAVYCKNGDAYNALYVGLMGRGSLANNANYICWYDNCGKNSNNLYVGILWTPADKYNNLSRTEIVNNIKSEVNFPCQEK